MQQAQGHTADRVDLAGIGDEGIAHAPQPSSQQDSNERDRAGQAWSPAPRTFLQLNESADGNLSQEGVVTGQVRGSS